MRPWQVAYEAGAKAMRELAAAEADKWTYSLFGGPPRWRNAVGDSIRALPVNCETLEQNATISKRGY